jgi:hypothetical protein
MVCSSGCGTEDIEDKKFQDLSGWIGVTLEDLLNRLGGQIDDEIRVYTVATTRLDKNSNIVGHKGSGPNLEGGLATLCTCKHSMRRNHTAEDWMKNKWILGLTSRTTSNGFNGEHYLFYLMKVDRAFESHKALFEHLKKHNAAALRIKNAVKNPLGDIFEPISACADPLNPRMYKLPHIKHSHAHDVGKGWEDDISFSYMSSPTKRSPTPLLLGDIRNTFVWPKPMIKFKQKRGVGNKKLTLGKVLSNEFIAR